jgi:hypothetical protein
MILIDVGLALASATQNLIRVYAAYGLGVGLGVSCSYVPAMGAVQRWFIKHRRFAFDISGSYTVPILISAAGNVIAVLIMAATSERGARQHLKGADKLMLC